MEVGDYVRTIDYLDNQFICKIDKIIDEYCINTDKGYWDTEHIIKSSPNIIDLIEVGDYVNGHKVLDIAQAPIRALYLEDISQKGALIPRINKDIKSIVTREMFESMEYKVGD